MQHKIKHLARNLHPARLTSLATYLLKDEAISGKFIIVAVALALLMVNSPLIHFYQHIWTTTLSIGFADRAISMDLQHWVSEALMALFFLAVGLEIRRERMTGELKDRRTAILPIAAAIGGMLVPALIYSFINYGSDSLNGWAIPTATDIALAIGVLALVGRRIPSSLRIFLLTLAIVDDVIAVSVIALFYTAELHILPMMVAMAIMSVIYSLERMHQLTLPIFILFGVALWITVYLSGIHASITGVVLGLLAPLAVGRNQVKSVAERVEKAIIPITTLIVVPLFAFANAGIILSFESFRDSSATQIASGIILGLVVGKVLGIVSASWIVIKLNLARLPSGSSWNQIIGVGMVAGIGFTVSIFITELAFTNQEHIEIAKMSIFIASIISAVLGYFALRFMNPRTGEIELE